MLACLPVYISFVAICGINLVVVSLQAGVIKQGPWGGNGGKTWNMGQADHISNVKIHYNDAIFAFDFTFTVDGKKKNIHVGGDEPQYNEVLSKLKTCA